MILTNDPDFARRLHDGIWLHCAYTVVGMGGRLDRILLSSSLISTAPKVLHCVLGRGPCTVDLVAADTIDHKTDRHPSTGEDSAGRTTKPSPQACQFHPRISAPARKSTRPTNKMAQPVPRVIDLSTLRSDGTNQGPNGYTPIPRQHADYRNYIRKKLTDAFNSNPNNNPYIADQLTKYSQHTFTL
jgi:hypothetical protein